MNQDAIDKLAAYFTGPAVAGHSIGMQMGAHDKIVAEAFFEVRGKLGIHGYCSKDTARRALERELE